MIIVILFQKINSQYKIELVYWWSNIFVCNRNWNSWVFFSPQGHTLWVGSFRLSLVTPGGLSSGFTYTNVPEGSKPPLMVPFSGHGYCIYNKNWSRKYHEFPKGINCCQTYFSIAKCITAAPIPLIIRVNSPFRMVIPYLICWCLDTRKPGSSHSLKFNGILALSSGGKALSLWTKTFKCAEYRAVGD